MLHFGVSASFLVNMCMKQNALNLSHEYPLAPMFVQKSFYHDDGLTGADDTQSAIQLQRKLDKLFAHGAFLLHKWNSNDPKVLELRR